MTAPTFFIFIDGTMMDYLFFLFDMIFKIFLGFFIGFGFFFHPSFLGLVKFFCGHYIIGQFQIFVVTSCSFCTNP